MTYLMTTSTEGPACVESILFITSVASAPDALSSKHWFACVVTPHPQHRHANNIAAANGVEQQQVRMPFAWRQPGNSEGVNEAHGPRIWATR